METVLARLRALGDNKNAAFQRKLTPGVAAERFLGVRVPAARRLAAELAGTEEADVFLAALPHTYFDEDLLHGLLVARLRDFDACLAAVDRFLPYVDNWAVCDTLSPAVFRRHRDALFGAARRWAASDRTYTCRFGIKMLMDHYLDEAFRPDCLAIPAGIVSGEYYVNMMRAWFYATALAKQWDDAAPYLERGVLDRWTHNKTIRKAVESYRITPEQKAYLKTLKR